MSYWGVHVGFAVVVTALVLSRTDLRRRTRWGVLVASGAWAVFPDLHNFVPVIKPWFRPMFHQSMLTNVFWLHRFIDRVDPGDEVVFSFVGWVVALAVVLLVEFRGRGGWQDK